MRKNMLKLIAIISILFMTVGLTSCDKSSNSAADSGNTNQKGDLGSNEYVLYTDSDPIENDKVKIVPDKPSCYGSGNYSLSLYFTITNKEYVTKEYEFKNIKLVKESTGAEYTARGYLGLNKVSIEAELNKSFIITSTIPASINTDKYKLILEINEYKITYYLYDTPDDLREDMTINYYIDNSIVKTTTIKDGRTFTNDYVYESSDNLYYCNTWWLDSNRLTKISSTTVINENTNLYGYKFSNLKWATTSSDVYSFVNGVNHVPSNGTLVIPSYYSNKEICIGNFAIKDINVKKIYVPKTVHKIYTGNFKGIGDATIYYEGTADEWKALFSYSYDVVTNNVVYNTKY